MPRGVPPISNGSFTARSTRRGRTYTPWSTHIRHGSCRLPPTRFRSGRSTTRRGFLGAGSPIFDIRDAFGATDMLLTTPAQAKALADTLGKSAVVLLRGHGHV